jgi:hypothetical protein
VLLRLLAELPVQEEAPSECGGGGWGVGGRQQEERYRRPKDSERLDKLF